MAILAAGQPGNGGEVGCHQLGKGGTEERQYLYTNTQGVTEDGGSRWDLGAGVRNGMGSESSTLGRAPNNKSCPRVRGLP